MNQDINLFNFYRRYLWTATDFTDWQTGMVDLARGMFEGTFNGSVLKGFEIDLSGSDLELTVGGGIACGPSGNLLGTDTPEVVELSAPVANPVRHLLVARPLITRNTPITRPTTPFDTVYLKEQQGMEIVLVEGTPAASPEYPASGANDVVLCGIRLQPAQTVLAALDIDLEVRDIPGRNSNFQQDAGKYDDRLRPYRSTNQVLGIKPSQLEAPFARVFSYVNKARPSIFPKSSGGNYNGLAGDTFLNFQTGAITGADEASANFTPTIPGAGMAIVAMVGIITDDTITVAYGTQGTRAQCYSGIVNQESSGAGSVSVPANTKPVAFVILYSSDGTNIRELDFFDCRGINGIGEGSSGVAGGGVSTPLSGEYPLTLSEDDDGKVILVDSSAARTINLPAAPGTGFKVTFKDYVGLMGTNNLTVARNGSAEIEGMAADYACQSDFGQWTFIFDGTDYWLI